MAQEDRMLRGTGGREDGGATVDRTRPDAPTDSAPPDRDAASRATGRDPDGRAATAERLQAEAAAWSDDADDLVTPAPEAGLDADGGPDISDGLGGRDLAGYDHAGLDDADAAGLHVEDEDGRVLDVDPDAMTFEGGAR
jgi:hypothetical protein